MCILSCACASSHVHVHAPPGAKVVDLIVECLLLKGREYVIQDKFHVAHSFSPYFCNQDPRFWDLAVKAWRHATTYQDAAALDTVKSALRAGKVKKTCTFKGVKHEIKLGDTWDDAKINEAIESGLFDEMFTLCDKPVVARHIKSAASLKLDVPAWYEMIIDATFEPDTGNGVRLPIKCNGKTLVASPQRMRELGTNALKRVLNCVPPDDVRHLAWTETGELDHNGFKVVSSNFHSCSAESWNSTQPDFVTGANVTKEAATAHHYEGNARQLMRKQSKLGQQEDLGTHNPMSAYEANRLAGHDSDSPMPRLVAARPHAIDRPPPVAADEICVQEIGTFAKRSGGGKRPELSAEDRRRLPDVRRQAIAAKPQQTQLAITARPLSSSTPVTAVTVVPPPPVLAATTPTTAATAAAPQRA